MSKSMDIPMDYHGNSQYPRTEVVYRPTGASDKDSHMEPSKDMKEESEKTEPVRWRDVLYDFTQNSTIVGLNHITEETPFRIRRIIWIILVVAGTCLFALQAMESIIMYYSRPVTVNVKVNYNDTLMFPAVTICNQNTFRISQSVKYGYYDLLTDAFSKQHAHEHEEEEDEDDERERKLHEAFGNTSLADVYNKTSHHIEDMVVSCQWDGRPCKPGDIRSTMTDHGACMTFNGETTGNIKQVTRIGSNGGLRLRLNIEQYEYMNGPIDGAGIKLLLHDQRDVPMIRSLGQAIPPGAHALVGLTILQVGNLEHPYGRCSDDKKLVYYDRYSQTACACDCQQVHLEEACKCRDVYMKPGKNDTVPICTLNQHLTCVTHEMESYERSENECICPISCKQTIYDPTITHATLSEFDQQKILLTNDEFREKLEKKFRAAREIRQHVDKDIYRHDAARLVKFLTATTKVRHVFMKLSFMLTAMRMRLDAMFYDWRTNYEFHRWGALYFMAYNIKHNFHRGWNVRDERTFRYLTFDYISFMENFKLNVGELERTANMTSIAKITYRDNLKWQIEKDIALRIDVTKRALKKIREIYHGFLNGSLLSTYKYTEIKKYDQLFTPMCLTESKHIITRNEEYFTKFKLKLTNMIDTLKGLKNISIAASKGTSIDDKLKDLKDLFFTLSKRINYHLFMYKDRVVEYALKQVENKLEKFDHLTTHLENCKNYMESEMKIMSSSITKFLDNGLKFLVDVQKISTEYLSEKKHTKSKLAKTFLSESMLTSMEDLNKVSTEVRARARNLKDGTRMLKGAIFDVYHSVFDDNCTNILYTYIRNEIDMIGQNRSYLDENIRYLFQQLLANIPIRDGQNVISFNDLDDLSAGELARITNADLPTRDVMDAKLEELLSKFEKDFEFSAALEHTDANFTNIVYKLRANLLAYTADGQIDTDFLRDNIINVDVFMRELNYQEIQQQIGYELTNLWSDIGGSIGLFIGASVLTVAEIIDVIVHTLSLKYCKRKH